MENTASPITFNVKGEPPITKNVTWSKEVLQFDRVHIYQTYIDQRNKNIVYSGTDKGLYESTDGGNTFNQIATEADSIGSTIVYCITPTKDGTIYVGTEYGLYDSSDEKTFNPIAPDSIGDFPVFYICETNSKIYLGSDRLYVGSGEDFTPIDGSGTISSLTEQNSILLLSTSTVFKTKKDYFGIWYYSL